MPHVHVALLPAPQELEGEVSAKHYYYPPASALREDFCQKIEEPEATGPLFLRTLAFLDLE